METSPSTLDQNVGVRSIGSCAVTGDTRYQITRGNRCAEISVTAEGTIRNDADHRSSWATKYGYPFNTAILAIERFRNASLKEAMDFVAARGLHRFVNPSLLSVAS